MRLAVHFLAYVGVPGKDAWCACLKNPGRTGYIPRAFSELYPSERAYSLDILEAVLQIIFTFFSLSFSIIGLARC